MTLVKEKEKTIEDSLRNKCNKNLNKRKKKNPYVYQAIQFVIGAELPFGVVQGMSARHLREIWVLGVWYVPAERVRKYSKRQKGYMFHTELNDDDADKALYGTCPEVVRVENCLRWHPMSRVESSVPRVVHANDVKSVALWLRVAKCIMCVASRQQRMFRVKNLSSLFYREGRLPCTPKRD
jgi:hypothetical protein